MKRLAMMTALLLTACEGANVSGKLPEEQPLPPVHVPVTTTPPVDAPIDPLAEPSIRARRRMDLDQLNAAIRRVTGGIGWTETRGEVEVDLFEELSLTLGKPNFIGTTREDLAPGAMFQKFLADAARSVCTRLIDREQNSSEHIFFVHATPRTTWARDPVAVNENLSALLLRFHGVDVAPDSTELNNWQWLFQSAESVSPDDPSAVWKTICVALLTHPDFFTY